MTEKIRERGIGAGAVILLFFLWMVFCPVSARAQEKPVYHRVLYISSYSYTWETVPEQIKGLDDELDESYIIDYEFMDTKNTVYDSMYTAFYDMLAYKLEYRDSYDAIVVADDAALDFARKYQEKLFSNTPIFFMGVDDLDSAREAAENPCITGVAEQVDYETCFRLAMEMQPKAKRFVFILDDSINGKGIKKALSKYLDELKDYEVAYLDSGQYSIDELKKELQKLNENDIVFALSMGIGPDGRLYTTDERFYLLEEYTHVPVFRVSASGVSRGLVGGYVIDHEACGSLIGQMIKSTMDGKSVEEQRMVSRTPSEYYFNEGVLLKYGLKVPSDIQNATYINQVPDFFEAHAEAIKRILIAVFLTMLCIIIVILWVVNRRRARFSQQLKETNESLEQANKAKTDFLSRMSHDMRTPMNGIIGLLHLSEKEEDVAVLRKNMEQMKESSSYLLSLINDTLDMNKIESDNLSLQKSVVDAEMFFQNITEMISFSAKEKKVNFYTEQKAKPLTGFVKIDEIRLKQIFINLLSNAVKFTPEGGVVQFVTEYLGREENVLKYKFEVIDNGVGMSEQFVRNSLFKPFSQERNELTSLYTGTGLGLAIVKSLVELMGGEIKVNSKVGEGTTFTVFLSFEQVQEKDAEQVQMKERVELEADFFKGREVLLVEDHPLNTQIETKLLENKGCHVTHAANGAEAIWMFGQSELGHYDVILMDIRMPIMDGLEATREIRALNRKDAGTVPIIAMTANAYEDDRQKSKAAGTNAHVDKPIEPALLFEEMARYIQLNESKEQ